MLTLESHIPLRHKRAMTTIGRRIRDARESLRLTQQQLADRLHVDQSTVSGWERDDKRRPGRDLMPAVAKALGRTVDWLEGRDVGLADRDRAYGDGSPAGAIDKAATGATVDADLLSEVIRMAMRNMLATYGVDMPDSRFEAAADAAASAYETYFRLRGRT